MLLVLKWLLYWLSKMRRQNQVSFFFIDTTEDKSDLWLVHFRGPSIHTDKMDTCGLNFTVIRTKCDHSAMETAGVSILSKKRFLLDNIKEEKTLTVRDKNDYRLKTFFFFFFRRDALKEQFGKEPSTVRCLAVKSAEASLKIDFWKWWKIYLCSMVMPRSACA